MTVSFMIYCNLHNLFAHHFSNALLQLGKSSKTGGFCFREGRAVTGGQIFGGVLTRGPSEGVNRATTE